MKNGKRDLVKTICMVMITIFVFSSVLSGCSEANNPGESTSPAETTDPASTPVENSLFFETKDVKIVMHDSATTVLSQLGEEISYFEAESCAFDGIDKTYSYPGFDLMTYPTDGKDFVSAVILRDDSVTTPQGLYIGAEESEIEVLHGLDYKADNPGVYVYEQDNCMLQIIAKDGAVISIEYLAITD